MKKYNYILFTAVLFVTSCALYEPKYREEFDETNFEKINPKDIEKTFYLIGDAGYAQAGKSTDALMVFEAYLNTHKEKGNYAIFLGDNIYPDGMPTKDSEDRPIAEHRLNTQINSIKNFDGEIIFIPGNHDWYNEGLAGLKREENYFEKKLGDKKLFYPTDGCALKSIDVSDKVQLIILDSQWYLTDWDKHPTINDKCDEIKTREAMFEEVEGLLKKNQNKTIVFALHHPLYTNGVHGGQYAPVKHLYPSQKKIPLPILSSLALQIRTSGGVSTQDKQNKQYKALVKRLETLAKGAEKIIFTSGHEHSLQYIEHEGLKQIVSGAGAKNSYASLSNDGLFAYGGQGFARLDILKNGASWVSFFSAKNGKPKLLYKKEVFKPTPQYDFTNLKTITDTKIRTSVYTPDENSEKSELYESVWGDHYRDLYYKPIEAKVALLDTLYGGLEVVRKGGGHQTRSLRLKDKSGKEYNMRALKKSGVKFLQSTLFKNNYVEESLENTLSEDILKDFYTASHPYIFTVIPELSDAIGLYHTNPDLLYIPKQPALKEYNFEHGNELYLIEERPEEHHIDLASFGKPKDIESTADVYKRLRKDEKYRIDEQAYIRARLFDMLIGDWDRHQDQWRWAEFELDNGDHVFRPIPRDRDQAFTNFDGGFLGALRGMIGFTRQFQVYDKKISNVPWLNASASILDRTLIQNSSQDIWLKEAKYIQKNLTDTVIEKAFENIPKEAKGTDLENIKASLKGRIDNLIETTNEYYEYHARLAIINGTDKDDYISIVRLPKGKTKITVQRIKDDKKSDTISNRIYDKKFTKQIRIYGLDDDDQFNVSGIPDNPIRIRIIGGHNNDTYSIENGKKVTIYDYKSKPNTIKKDGGAKFKFTDNYQINNFDKDNRELTTTTILPLIGFNPDDGLLIGPVSVITKSDFYENPFTLQHRLSGGYYFATGGFDLAYRGEFAGILGKYNLLVTTRYTSPNYAVNFFGFGNNSENFDDRDDIDFDFNRVKLSTYQLMLGAVKNGRDGSYFEYTASAEGIQIDRTPGRFIADFFENEETYERKWFAGTNATYRYESYDVVVNPTRGMKFELNGGTRTNINNGSTYGFIKPYLGFYNALTNNRKLVLKTSAMSHFNIGTNYEFYQSAQIGGENLLRGFRKHRFAGQTAFATSADVRYSFNQFKTKVLPLQFGLFTGIDTGRVWLDNSEETNKWHTNYGGGFWVNSADFISGTFNLFASREGPRFSFNFLFKL
ncbi:metallophosphoesterase [Aquimarina agarilytica]|uniref:metallophosphoesterase n=1 Tax=Aquimarina agarilytica TaxID=1087449 RepID=UPI0002895FFE|nr:metallophosphoesterase [Aquimarina agarilytica]